MIDIEKFICSIMEQKSEYHNAPINRSHIQEALREQGYECNNGAIGKINTNWESSEDERIRYKIIDYLSNEMHNVKQLTPLTNEFKAWIAYLEKQKKQNPIPKFKVGDCIYDRRDSYNRNVIREVGKDYYINAFAQKMDMAYTDANFEYLEHLDNDLIDSKPAEWTIKDAKPGDILTTDKVTFIFKSVDKNGFVSMYCSYAVSTMGTNLNLSDTATVDSEYVHPASIEQRREFLEELLSHLSFFHRKT